MMLNQTFRARWRTAAASIGGAVAALTMMAGVATADPVTIERLSGGFSVTGELERFNGTVFALRTRDGLITVPLAGHRCIGDDCPEAASAPAAPIETGSTENGAQTSLRAASLLEETAPAEPTPPPYEDTGVFSIRGSNTIGAALMPAIVRAYADSIDAEARLDVGAAPEEIVMTLFNGGDPQIAEIDLRSHGSGTSAEALSAWEAEIGMSSRRIKTSESGGIGDATVMRGPGNEHVLALDGLIVIVSKASPVQNLSLEQVADIFAGRIDNWSAVGGPDAPITVHARDAKSGTFDTFASLVLKPFGVDLTPLASRYESNQRLSDAVAADPNAIGFTGFAYLRNAKALPLATECGLVYAPTEFSVKTEEYPLARRLYLYTNGAPRAQHARDLLGFALSDDAQDTVTEAGFINQSIDAKSLSDQGMRFAKAFLAPMSQTERRLMERLTQTLLFADRLSTTFRFETASVRLDTKARQDVARFADFLESGALKGKEVLFVGFADSSGDFEVNERLSLNRADVVSQAVRDELTRLPEEVRLTTFAGSELSPVGCNTSDAGKRINRRVEIWVRPI